MYKNLLAEMARHSISRQQISDAICVTYNTARLKLRGECDFTLSEARKIKETFFPEHKYEYLFSICDTD